MYHCPVCGYDQLQRPPEDFYICPCCGTEFGNHDDEFTHEQLRANWLRKLTPWFSRATTPPVGWSSYDQLMSAGLISPSTALSATFSEDTDWAMDVDAPVQILIGPEEAVYHFA